MKPHPAFDPVSSSLWLLNRLLALYPAEHQRTYRADMVQTFQDCASEAYAQHGLPGLLRLWLATLPDVVMNALDERIAGVNGSGQAARRVGGLVLVAGGLLWMGAHLPFGLTRYGLPAAALFLLLGGVCILHAQNRRHLRRTGWVGFILTASGLAMMLAGYMAAWLDGWQQTGITVLFGAGLQAAGLLAWGLETRLPQAADRLLVVIGLLNGVEVLWMAQVMKIEWAALSWLLLALVGQAILIGLAWAALGWLLWTSHDQPAIRLAEE